MPWNFRSLDEHAVLVGMTTSPMNKHSTAFTSDLGAAMDTIEKEHEAYTVVPKVLASLETRRLLAKRYRAIKGAWPSWHPG